MLYRGEWLIPSWGLGFNENDDDDDKESGMIYEKVGTEKGVGGGRDEDEDESK